jgi:hypothetical protein
MQEVPLSWAMLVAAIIRFVVGGLWFSPFAFAEPWRRLVGLSAEQMKATMPKAIAADVVASLLMAWVLAHAVIYAGATTFGSGRGGRILQLARLHRGDPVHCRALRAEVAQAVRDPIRLQSGVAAADGRAAGRLAVT